jgi:hypothetical protein
MTNTLILLDDYPTGTPRRAVLKRVCRSCFEPRRGRDPVSAYSLESQPERAAGHSGDHPPEPGTVRAPQRARIPSLIQGNLCASGSSSERTLGCATVTLPGWSKLRV